MKVSNTQRITINFIKWVLFAAVMVTLIVMLTRSAGATSSADFKTLQANVIQVSETDKMKQGDNRMLRRLYGIDTELFEDMVFYYPASNMGAEELLFVRLKNEADVAAVKELIEQRNASQIRAFEGYGVEQTQLLKDAVLSEHGRDLLYSVGNQSKDVEEAYLKT